MFDYLKQRKTKKLLIDLNRSYLNLLGDKQEYVDTTKDPSSLQEAVISKFNLELTRTVSLFEELRTTYPDFNTISSDEDLWKLNKPLEAEGMAFIADPSLSIVVRNPSQYCANFQRYQGQIEHISASNLKPYLEQTLKAAKYVKYQEATRQRLEDFSTPHPAEVDRILFTLKDATYPIAIKTFLGLNHLNEVAKHFKINIIRS